MDLLRKKVVILNFDDLVGTGGMEDFHFRMDILDRISSLKNIVKVVIAHDKDERRYLPQLKAVEMFVFIYCKCAASCMASLDGLMASLPHNLRRTDLIFSLDKRRAGEAGVGYLDISKFLCTQ